MSPRQAALVETRLPALALDLDTPPPATLGALFPNPVRAVRLEIGFGAAEHLAHEARSHPEIGHIGAEAYLNGIAKALVAIEEEDLSNVRLHGSDARALLEWLPDAALDRIDLLYPDPWPKRRHWKRRFIAPDTVSEIARVLTPGGLLRFASDIPSYVDWTLQRVRAHPAFAWTARSAADWRAPYPGFPGTRYEDKARAAGRVPTYLSFVRRD